MELVNLTLSDLYVLRKQLEYQFVEIELKFPKEIFGFGIDQVVYSEEKAAFMVPGFNSNNESDFNRPLIEFKMLKEDKLKEIIKLDSRMYSQKVVSINGEMLIKSPNNSSFKYIDKKGNLIINEALSKGLYNIDWIDFNKIFSEYRELVTKFVEVDSLIRKKTQEILNEDTLENLYEDIDLLIKALKIDYDRAIYELAIYFKEKMKFKTDTESNIYLSGIINRTPEAIKQARTRSLAKLK